MSGGEHFSYCKHHSQAYPTGGYCPACGPKTERAVPAASLRQAVHDEREACAQTVEACGEFLKTTAGPGAVRAVVLDMLGTVAVAIRERGEP